MSDIYQPNILVISGGGPKGISFVGALTELKEKKKFNIQKIKVLSGSSIGGVICTAICFGYTLEEIKEWFLSTDFSLLCPVLYDENYTTKILPILYKKFSIGTGEKIKDILEKTFFTKNIDINITFDDLYKKTNKILILTGSNLNTRKAEYFSYDKTPNMKILDALFITSRIPFIFPAITLNNNTYVDGHVFDPFPIKCCKKYIEKDKRKILGIVSFLSKKNKEINNIKKFTFSLIEGLSYQYMKKSIQRYKKNIISIEIDSSFFNLKISKNEMINMFEKGKLSANVFISNIS